MARQFLVFAPGQDDLWAGPFSLDNVLDKADRRTVVGQGPFTRRRNHERVGIPLWRGAVLRAFGFNIRSGGVGDVFSLRKRDRSEVIRIREVQPSVEVINTNGNDKADAAWTAVIKQFPEIPIYFLGAYVCKYVAGSYTRSQHSYGNAIDFGSDSMDNLRLIARYLVANASALQAEHVIVDDEVWTRGYGTSHYNGERHYHVHIDFAPEQYGGCGVRG